MRFNYEFSNLCGTVYSQGNLKFTPDGGSLISPVGNRVTAFDLENSKSLTLPLQNTRSIECIGVSPDGRIAITVDEAGKALLINYKRGVILHRFNFKAPVKALEFSPDSLYFAVSHGKHVQVWHTPTMNREFAPFVLHRTYAGHYDEVISLDWDLSSSHFISGSRDLTARIWSLNPEEGYPVTLPGHKDSVVAAFLAPQPLQAYTVARDGTLVVWKKEEGDEEGVVKEPVKVGAKRIRDRAGWKIETRHFFHQTKVQCAAFHKKSGLLVAGFANGIFGLYEMPGCTNLHTLSISSQKISAVAINASGEWLAFGSEKLGQLLVWEWQSETYVLKQQGHSYGMNAIDYSPNGSQLTSGGEDGKVKVWNASTGFCFITFSEHTAAVKAVKFMGSGNAVLSASLDGSVRAFDLVRYRNFRTLTTPKATQFLSLALDPSDEIVCAGTQDSFEIFVWSMKTGRLLDILSGHEGPVSCLSFNPIQPVLASSSWDKTVKLWDVFETKAATMTLQHSSDVLCVSYRPDGKELITSSLDGHLHIWNAIDGNLAGVIEARRDVVGGRKNSDKSTFAAQAASSCFTTVSYSADGKFVLAGGNTKWICIYNVARRLCVKKFQITENLSIDGVAERLNSKHMTGAGPLEEIDHDSDAEMGDSIDRRDDSLPGVQKSAAASKRNRPAVRSVCTRFSPTGRSWSAATTEGLLMYSLDEVSSFDPLDLDIDITPARIYKALEDGELLEALLMGLRLNEIDVMRAVYERTPTKEITGLARAIPEVYLKRMLELVVSQVNASPHVEFHLCWAESLLLNHGNTIMANRSQYTATLRALHMAFSNQFKDVAKLCNSNHYSLAFLTASAEFSNQE